MKNQSIKPAQLDQYLGCFGSISLEDTVCRRFCVLNLRCAIEKDQNTRMELMDEMEFADDMMLRTQ